MIRRGSALRNYKIWCSFAILLLAFLQNLLLFSWTFFLCPISSAVDAVLYPSTFPFLLWISASFYFTSNFYCTWNFCDFICDVYTIFSCFNYLLLFYRLNKCYMGLWCWFWFTEREALLQKWAVYKIPRHVTAFSTVVLVTVTMEITVNTSTILIKYLFAQGNGSLKLPE